MRFLDLGLRSAHDDVAEVAASALGLMVQSDDLATSIVDHLYNRQMLLVFDCCEHVIDSAAALAETIIREAPQVSILATSREALRAEGEHVYALGSLDTPPEGLSVGARQLLDYPAAQLFVERVIGQRSPRDVQRLRSTDRRRHLPQGRRHRAGPRARREPHQHPRPAGDGRSPRQPPQAALAGPSHGLAEAPDAACNARLEVTA